MKLSKYNTYHEMDDKMIVYNSLNGNLGVIDKQIYQEKKFNSEEMLHYGFMVNDEQEEDSLAKYQLSKILHTSDLNLTILVSENCNFRCQYCFDEFNRKNISQETINNIANYVRKNIHKYTGINISWFGGEPLLARNSIEELSDKIIEICRASSRRYNANITTNGYLLDLETFKSLRKRKVYSFEITIDGLEDIHDKNRPHKDGGGTFWKIIDNLRMIRDNVNSGTFQIVIRTNVTRTMMKNFNKFNDFISREFGADKRFIFDVCLAYDWGGERISGIRDELLDSSQEMYEMLLHKDINIPQNRIKSRLDTKVCGYAIDNTYTINTEGGIILCPQINSNYIGILKDGNINIDQYKLAEWYSLSSNQIEGCVKCNRYYLCQGKICPANLKAIKDNNMRIDDLKCKKREGDLTTILTYLYKYNREKFIRLGRNRENECE